GGYISKKNMGILGYLYRHIVSAGVVFFHLHGFITQHTDLLDGVNLLKFKNRIFHSWRATSLLLAGPFILYEPHTVSLFVLHHYLLFIQNYRQKYFRLSGQEIREVTHFLIEMEYQQSNFLYAHAKCLLLSHYVS
ncbi:hypothetical protein ACJX0J_032979, partial [Zea mays]